MRLLSSSRRGIHQPASSTPHLSGWPFTPDSAWIMTTDRLGRGLVDRGGNNNNSSAMINLAPVGALATVLPTTQGWALQFNGTNNYLESAALPTITTYPMAIGAVFRHITGAAGTSVAITDRLSASFGNFYALAITGNAVEGDVKPTATTQLTLTSAANSLVAGNIYAAALVSVHELSHHLWLNGIHVSSAINQGTPPSLNRIQIGGLARNSTPTILNVSNYPILMAWCGVMSAPVGNQSGALSDLVGQWTKDPWRMFRTTNNAAGLT